LLTSQLFFSWTIRLELCRIIGTFDFGLFVTSELEAELVLIDLNGVAERDALIERLFIDNSLNNEIDY
jgi:hypothetical protein